MIEIIGVRFKNGGKVYYFSPGSWKVKSGDLVITETARGTECGEVAIANKQIPKEQVTAPLKQILRVATREDRHTGTEPEKGRAGIPGMPAEDRLSESENESGGRGMYV